MEVQGATVRPQSKAGKPRVTRMRLEVTEIAKRERAKGGRVIAKFENVEVRWESQHRRRRRLLGRLVQEELVRCRGR